MEASCKQGLQDYCVGGGNEGDAVPEVARDGAKKINRTIANTDRLKVTEKEEKVAEDSGHATINVTEAAPCAIPPFKPLLLTWQGLSYR